MTLAYAQRAFAGRDRYSAEYLNIEKGDPLVVDEQSVDEGWVLAAKVEDSQWNTGWIPATYWSVDPPEKVREHLLEDLFREETFGNMADTIVDYVGQRGLGSPLSRYSPAGALIPTARFMANYVTVNMRNRQQWEQVAYWEEAFPTLRADVLQYGMPGRLYAFPEWSAWKMLVEVYYDQYTPAANDFGEGWHFWEQRWLRDLREVDRAFERVNQTAGFYKHLQICLEEWCWDYLDQTWEPRNCI